MKSIYRLDQTMHINSNKQWHRKKINEKKKKKTKKHKNDKDNRQS